MTETRQTQICVRALTKSYKQGESTVIAADAVNLDVAAGDFLIITGRSGSGKTTLLSLLGRLTQPSAGTIFIDGVDLLTLDDQSLSHFRAQKIGFVFQFASLLPTLTVLENVCLPGLFTTGSVDAKRAAKLLTLVGLGDKIKNYPPQLSGGQRRRVAIARALVNRPEILLADEPTGDLDVETESEILELFRSFNAQGMTIILVTHNPNLTMLGNRLFQMERGRLIETRNQGLTLCGTGQVLASSFS